jgi:acetolactate synthase-1/3 small subunit
MQQTLVALVDDRPGVLNRVASLFRRRAFNIESLTVGRTAETGVSRMTILIDSDGTNAERVMAYLRRLVDVRHVENLAGVPSIVRDLALVKVSAGADRTSLLQAADEMRARVLDCGEHTMTVEVTGDPGHIDAALARLQPHGILEMVRTGQIAMRRGDGVVAEDSSLEEGKETNGHDVLR